MDLDKIFDELFPICRSITGEGIRTSLNILSEHIPLEVRSIKTGTKVFDWEVPKEWSLNRARLISPSGKIVVDSKNNNLHVVNFSESFNGEIDLEHLKENIHTIPELPAAIPYVTSYYQKRWGLCMSHHEYQKLEPGTYRVIIDTEKKDGHLNYGICELPGNTEENFIISTYLCHPSMANNELSGPLAMLYIYKQLSLIKNRKFNYRFIVVPETIGSISYLATDQTATKDIAGGIVLTCLGGKKEKLSFKLSRRDWLGQPSEVDLLARYLANKNPEEYSIREFTPTGGSDERQYCSPKINLPVIQAAKLFYGEYEEYHTSLDTKDLMGIKSVIDSSEGILKLLKLFELKRNELFTDFKRVEPHGRQEKKINSTIQGGEPQLSKYDLYPSLNSPMTFKHSNDGVEDGRTQLEYILNILSLSDGSKDVAALAKKLETSIDNIVPLIDLLEKKGLINIT